MAKLIRYLLIAFAVILSITACDILGSDKKEKTPEVVGKEYTTENGNSVEKNANDSTPQQLAERMKEISKSAVRWHVIAMAAIVLVVITLLLTLYYKHKVKQLGEKTNECFRELKSLQDAVEKAQWKQIQRQGAKSDVMSSMERYYHTLEERVSKLEKDRVKANTSPQRNNAIPPQTASDKVVYVKSSYQNIFTEVFHSKQESCVYKIKLINDHEGEFDLIDSTKLNIMRQISYKDVVDVVEGCPLAEATDYKPISFGKCIKTSEGRDSAWKVTEKLKIKTLK